MPKSKSKSKSNKSVADYLTECNLLDQVLDGIDKIPALADEVKEKAINEICEWKMDIISKTAHVAGRCCYYTKKIQLHAELLKSGREADRDVTLLHEIGHLLTGLVYRFRVPKPHGKEWKYITRLIGGTPVRCHSFEYFNELSKSGAKHKYICQDCGWEHFTKRELKNIEYRHHNGCKHKKNGGHFTHIVLL